MTQKLRVSREDGLILGKWFAEDPTLKIVEISLSGSERAAFKNTEVIKTHRPKRAFVDNIFVNRLFNLTLGSLIIPGLCTAWAVQIAGIYGGYASVFIFSVVDLIFGGTFIIKSIENERK